MIETWFPRWSQAILETTAQRHAIDLDMEYGRSSSEAGDIDRLVVNMLRHELTRYNEDQSQETHRLICEAIKARYAWLTHECDRRIEKRASAERESKIYGEILQDWANEDRERRAERSQLSSEVIGTMKVGDRVIARIAGRERTGTISWIGRRRLEVRYNIKSGELRTRRLYACDVREAVAGT
jgi:hypothetical protein